MARVCVEVDLLKELPKHIRIGDEEMELLQPILYEDLPYYCTKCHTVGHSNSVCKNKGQGKEQFRLLKKTSDQVHQKNKEVEVPVGKPILPLDEPPSTSGLTDQDKAQTVTDIPAQSNENVMEIPQLEEQNQTALPAVLEDLAPLEKPVETILNDHEPVIQEIAEFPPLPSKDPSQQPQEIPAPPMDSLVTTLSD